MKNLIYDDGVNILSIEVLYFVGRYATYEVCISASGFAGKSSFCIEENNIKIIVEKATTMIDTLCGEVVVNDTESDAFLKFFFGNERELYVVGQIGGSWDDNMLKFKMRADQTILKGLKNALLAY